MACELGLVCGEVALILAAQLGNAGARFADFLLVMEAPDEQKVHGLLATVRASGAVSHMKTTVAITSQQAKGAFAEASDLAYRPPGQK